MSVYTERFRELSRRTQAGLAAVVMALAAVAPVVFAGNTSAAPALQSRTLTSTSAVPGANTQLEWTFDTTADTANAKQIVIDFCEKPLGTCGATNTPTVAGSPTATLSGPWTTPDVTSAAYSGRTLTIVKDNADDATSKTGLKITLGGNDVTNFGTANRTYYTRMKIYSDTGTTLVWEGVFAQSTSQTLTVNARVQERLDFCVGSTGVDDGITDPGAGCGNITGSSVDIGNIDSGGINVSPVTTINGGSNQNGIAMVRTNAVHGANVAYRALGETSSGTLKVPGATCVASPISDTGTDQCFDTSSTQNSFAAGIERFGMTVAAVNCVSTSAYTCAFADDNYNLRRDASYDGNASNVYATGDKDIVVGSTANGYAWDADPTHTTTIASSMSAPSGVYVIDDEALILKFAATSGITTPTGSYTVQADFIATTTF